MAQDGEREQEGQRGQEQGRKGEGQSGNGPANMAPTPTAPQIEERIEERASDERRRSTPQILLSGLIGGLDIGFSPLGLAFVASALSPLIGRNAALLLGALLYPIGFIFVVLGRSELFTESTLTPALGVLSGSTTMRDLVRQWALVLGANLAGVTIFALLLAHSGKLAAHYGPVFVDETRSLLSYGWGGTFVSAVFAGWVMAVLSWLISAADSTTARILFVYFATFLIGAAPLHHSISGGAEVLTSVFLGGATGGQWFWGFQVPATLGNAVGGVVVVAALRFLQAEGPRRRMARIAERNGRM